MTRLRTVGVAVLGAFLAVSSCTETGNTPPSRGPSTAIASRTSPSENSSSPAPSPSRTSEASIQVDISQSTVVRFISINLAQPPFDAIHVRRAATYAIDRQALLRARYPDGYRGTPATHLFPDILEDGLLRDFDPYPGPDLDAARAEMRRSRHDSDGDGRCDAKECEQVLAITPEEASATRAAKELTRQLEPIGIHLRVATCCQTMYGKCSDPLTPTRSVWRTCSVPITRMR
ncbi:MAG TPA: ABC transporter substrate-binding protein [Actinomycetota bacterium]